jgi:hypothetical protein
MRKLVFLFLLAPAGWGQDIVSARSGLIHHIEGTVRLEGQPVEIGNARFPVIAKGEVLSVQEGYAEILLTPGAILRLDTGASVRLVENALDGTRLELLSGAALVQVDELLKGNHIRVTAGGYETALLKNGLYYFDADSDRVKVFDGKVQTWLGGAPVELGKGRTILLDSDAKVEKVDRKKSRDALYAWSENRAERLAAANISASRSWNGGRVRTSFWVWDPYLGIYTFMPGSGSASIAFGGRWYNPQTVWIVFQPQADWGGSSGLGLSQGRAPSGPSSGGGGYSAPTPVSGGAGPSGGQTVVNTTTSGATVSHTVGGHGQE